MGKRTVCTRRRRLRGRVFECSTAVSGTWTDSPVLRIFDGLYYTHKRSLLLRYLSPLEAFELAGIDVVCLVFALVYQVCNRV